MPADREKPEEIHGECEDMVEGQHGQNMVAFPHVVAPEIYELPDIDEKIAVCQHRSFALTRSTSRILETGCRGGLEAVRIILDIESAINVDRAQGQRSGNGRMAELRRRHFSFHIFQHKS